MIYNFPKIRWHVPPPLIHALVWIFIYLVPIILMPEMPLKFRYWTTVPFFAVLASFYINYSLLIPKFLYNKRVAAYVIVNLAIFLLLSYLIGIWENQALELGVLQKKPEPEIRFSWLIKTIIWFIFVCGIAIAVRSTSMWFHSKEVVQEFEIEQVRSELMFLKSQISPHFLFNMLNNILALIDENKELAKETIQQLSKLLRTIIYDSREDFITIKNEVVFLTNYSNLMRLRYGTELKFNLETDLQEPEAPIAPLLLISMLENVFKHGISSSLEDSFINVKISSKNGKIIFESINTYFPKATQDKSGSGIGVINTRKRLELLYENKYIYDCKIENGNYIVKLVITY